VPHNITGTAECYAAREILFTLVLPPQYGAGQGRVWKELEQEFSNNCFVLRASRNQEAVKVPLSCLVKHLGLLFYCQASWPALYRRVEGT
jgi:hypothetical protein